ncbi:MAG: DsbA family protein [Thiotrichales bacterium]|nr:DsbA family protein [Thiotrichales bacterium]
MATELIYVHDPMCSWCWAFRPTYDRLVRNLPAGLRLQRLLGGLAADTDDPMPEATRRYVQNHWRRIQQQVPGTEFNFDFWDRCRPRRATYPACRAVIAARNQGEQYDDAMTLAIQRAYYLEARNPSNIDTLLQLAAGLELDIERFRTDLPAAATQDRLMQEIRTLESMGIERFPSLAIKTADTLQMLAIDYHDAGTILSGINKQLYGQRAS